eukprot:3186201-Prymnesium_polylepis.4
MVMIGLQRTTQKRMPRQTFLSSCLAERIARKCARLLFTLTPVSLFPEPGATKCRPFVLAAPGSTKG